MSAISHVSVISRSLWIWTAGIALVIARVPLMAVIRLFERDPLHRATARSFRRLGVALTKINPWRLHITGTEHVDPTKAYILVSNHQSLADIPLISHVRIDTKWLAKAELFRIPVVGWMMRMAGDIPVDRSDRRKAAQALLQAARYLRRGCSVVFFPEGTRSRTGEVLAFNDGPFQLAIREQIPVLPLVVEGSGAALPRNSWSFGPTQDVELRILPPVEVEAWASRKASELRDAVRQRIVDELERIRTANSNLIQWQRPS